jgi:hypothetical protein
MPCSKLLPWGAEDARTENPVQRGELNPNQKIKPRFLKESEELKKLQPLIRSPSLSWFIGY